MLTTERFFFYFPKKIAIANFCSNNVHKRLKKKHIFSANDAKIESEQEIPKGSK
jgi:hypothetical protein